MGRIDDALRRASVDAAAGTGAPEFSAAPPWSFDPREGSARASLPPVDLEAAAALALPALDDGEAGLHGGGAGLHGGGAGLQPCSHGFDPAMAERLVVSADAGPLLIEQFRGLAATLIQAQNGQPLKSVLVTSASPGDGKSLVAVNLALTLSESFKRRVLLVDADLRRPVLHDVFGVENARGLGEALSPIAPEPPRPLPVTPRLALLPAGRPQADPLGGLSSGRMKGIVSDAAQRFDWVIVDSPPVGVLADGRLVSEAVDGVIVVVRAGVTRFPDLDAAADVLGHDRILGLVLNGVDPASIRGEGYYHHYYGRRAPAANVK
jgi:capsular exopolysaccharide synthesis family protein